ncbi:MAG TPA: membrane protein insertion efficiency factor YidD [Thermoanaerobaculia bacterium]|nr:membrane protein insertion efficiency factor YidD [Thermoanaerobaculia bacterium]
MSLRLWLRQHGRTAAVVLVLTVLFALDMARPPREQWTAKGLLAAIHLYQATLSPHMSQVGVRCRFTPTCSHYGEGAIRKYGTLVGTIRTAWRIARCGPWTPAGTYDPP